MATNRGYKNLLKYDQYDEDDDYHLPAKTKEKTPSQRYDELTRNLTTGNREYGLHYPESPRADDSYKSSSDYDFITGQPRGRRAGVSKQAGSDTPNYGRRSLITGKGNGESGAGFSLSERGETPLFPAAARRKSNDAKVPSVSNQNKSSDYSYKDVQASYLSSKKADTIKLSDIAQIDLVLTLNDKTKVVVKAAPFKPYQF